MSIEIPPGLRRAVAGRPPEPDVSGDDWLRALPRVLDEAMDRWDLLPDGAPRSGGHTLVVPVRRRDGVTAALKAGWPRARSRHEHLALRAWNGDGAVALLAADPASSTLLLARLDPDRDLHALPIDEACAVLGSLVARLDRPALPQLDRLSAWAAHATGLDSPPASAVPRRFLHQARATITGLVAGAAVDARLVHTGLAYANVLRGQGGWTAIAPTPMAGEPAFPVWPALQGRWAEAGGQVAWAMHSRLGWICDAAGIDEDRARAWAFVRTVSDAVYAAGAGDATRLTARIALAKALQQRW